jgi:hypothetical protein
MELLVLERLNWKVNFVTPIVLITYMLSQFKIPETQLPHIYSVAHRCAESLQAEHIFMCYHASEIAMVSIYWAFQIVNLPESLFFCGLYNIRDLLCTEHFNRAAECHRLMFEDIPNHESLNSALFCRPEFEIVSTY